MNSPHDAGAKPRPHPQRIDAPNKPSYYNFLPIPIKLLDSLYRWPLSIGIYIVVCRLFLINGGKPVPLSDHDLMLIDASLSRGAIIRAFTHLVNGGWLIKDTSGFKTHYTPAWGMINGAPRAWSLVSSLGKPKHIRTLRIAVEPLNDLGKIAPHATQPARIVRYPDATPITLRDIGEMALNRHVTPKTPAPESVVAPDTAPAKPASAAPTEPAPTPPTPATPAAPAPTEPAPTPLTGTDAVLPPVHPIQQRSGAIMVLHAMIWSLIGTILVSLIMQLIQLKTRCDHTIGSLQQLQATLPPSRAMSPTSPTSMTKQDEQIPPSHPVIGGGCSHHSETSGAPEPPTSAQPDEPEVRPETTEQHHTVAHPTKKRPPSTPEPVTPAYRLLRELHINPKVCHELADLSADLVKDVIALAYENDVHSVPGWVVAVLRQKQTDIAAGVPPVVRQQRSRFALFDALADDTPASPSELCNIPNEPAEPHQDASLDGAEPAEPRQDTSQDTPAKPAQRQDDPSVLLEQARAAGDLDAAWALVLDMIRYRIPRSEYDLIARASLRHWTEKEAVIACRDLPHKQQVEDKFIPVLRDVLGVARLVCLIRA